MVAKPNNSLYILDFLQGLAFAAAGRDPPLFEVDFGTLDLLVSGVYVAAREPRGVICFTEYSG